MPNAYPSLPQAEGTKLVPRAGTRLRYAANGTVRTRVESSAPRYDPVLVHKGLSLDQWSGVSGLKTFYEANRGAIVTVAYGALESISLNCVFAEKPFDVEPQIGNPGWFNVTVYLVQAD